MSISLNTSIQERSSIVSGIESLDSIASRSSQVETHLDMRLQARVADNTYTGDLTQALIALWHQHYAAMGYRYDGTGRVSFAIFEIGEWRFYALVARSGMDETVRPDDFLVFAADTTYHMKEILDGKTSDKYLTEWILSEFEDWEWPLIQTQWVKSYEITAA